MCAMADLVTAMPLNPVVSPVLDWLGGQASQVATDAWKTAMVGLWSAGLWLLKLAFSIIDHFTAPDLSAGGPMQAALPVTLWLGGSVAALTLFLQIGMAFVRRDGQSLGRVVLGLAQFGLVWACYLAIADGLVIAASGLEHGLLRALLHVDSFGAFDESSSWPRHVTDATLATVLGILSLLLVIPSAFFYLVIMFVREAALIVLVATAPITAAGLLSESTKAWFWKSLRWFIACLLIAPTAALVLGVGVRMSSGVVSGTGDNTTAAAGMAVVGVVLVVIGAICPLVLFRLLAFVDPGSASGAALRQSWHDAGGMAGVLGSGRTGMSVGTGVAAQTTGDGRSAGESGAESVTHGRFASAVAGMRPAAQMLGAGIGATAAFAQRAVDIASDVLGQSGVGHAGYSMTPTDERTSRRPTRTASGNDASSTGPTEPPAPDALPDLPVTTPVTSPTPVSPTAVGDTGAATGGTPS